MWVGVFAYNEEELTEGCLARIPYREDFARCRISRIGLEMVLRRDGATLNWRRA
jgi:hypothetical protein